MQTPTGAGADPGDRGSPVPFPIVGIGASAGGLEAFRQLLGALPPDTGMGFVLVQHLDPEHESALVQLLSRATSLPVREIANDQPVLVDHVHVIPRDTHLTISGGVLKLEPRQRMRTPHRPIDAFFESLAEDRHEGAIGVVLSGTASDGTLGLEAIKAGGGITFAQDDSARHDSLPRSAIAAGCVDLVLSPAEIARELARIARHPYLADDGSDASTDAEEARASAAAHAHDSAPLSSGGSGTPRTGAKRARDRARSGRVRGAAARGGAGAAADNGYKKVLLLLRNHSGVDFSLYKSNTIRRRINRRLVVNQQRTPAAYADFLRGNTRELEALYSDVLIGVTSFFRNPEMFEALQREVLPELLRQPGDDPIRCWVLGCSTGQEAYSIAIAFVEAMDKAPRLRKLQVFATDLNDALLDKARHGLYARSLSDDIAPERLRRFFVEEQGGWRVAKSLREMVVFARQNLIADPPFSRLDLISCRNLLIYLEPSLQDRVIPTFHYALKPRGFLLLGASESIGGFTELFAPVDRKHRIYSKKPGPTPAAHLPLHRAPGTVPLPGRLRTGRVPARAEPWPAEHFGGELSAQREADRVTVGQFAPPGVLVSAERQILQFRGPTGAYLEPPAGRASFDLLKMARPGLAGPLRAALEQAAKEDTAARRENVRVERNGAAHTVHVQVLPLKNLRERCFLVLFEEAGGGGTARATEAGAPEQGARGAPCRRSRSRAGRGARLPPVGAGAARGGDRGAAGEQRRGPVRQRRATERERGAGDVQGGAGVGQRGADDPQRRDDQPQRRAEPAPRRPAQPPELDPAPHRAAGAGPEHPPLQRAGREAAQPAVQRRGAAHRPHPPRSDRHAAAVPTDRGPADEPPGSPRPGASERRGHRRGPRAGARSARRRGPLVLPARAPLHDARGQGGRRGAGAGGRRCAQAQRAGRRPRPPFRREHDRDPAHGAPRARQGPEGRTGQSLLQSPVPRQSGRDHRHVRLRPGQPPVGHPGAAQATRGNPAPEQHRGRFRGRPPLRATRSPHHVAQRRPQPRPHTKGRPDPAVDRGRHRAQTGRGSAPAGLRRAPGERRGAGPLQSARGGARVADDRAEAGGQRAAPAAGRAGPLSDRVRARDGARAEASRRGDGVKPARKDPRPVRRKRLVPLAQILRSEELHRRPQRAPDHETENRALRALAQALAERPQTLLEVLAETVLEVLRCDSAGLSLLTPDERTFTWPAIAGAWQPYRGGGTPRNFGPCGDVLDRNTPLLFTRWERRYPYLLAMTPPAEEGLLVPFYASGMAIGTIWALAHDERRRFDAEDLRLLESLGHFASAAYQVVKSSPDAQAQRRAALNLMEDAVQTRQRAEDLNRQLRAEIAERERAVALLLSQREALEMVARQTPLSELLKFLTRAAESQSQDRMMAAIHLLNTEGTHFASTAAPSLPPEYHEATQGMAVDPQSGPCCQAVASREPVLVPDLARDPRWPRFAELAMVCGIQAGWSMPILSTAGTALGTFTLYYPEPRAPSPLDEQLVGILTRTVAMAIEHARARVAQARLAAIVTSSEDAIISKNLDGIITSWNRSAQHLFGYTAEEAVGRPITMLIPRDHVDEEATILARIRRGEGIDHYETVRRRKDGTLLDVSLTVSPLRDAAGRIVGASKVARDITERRRIEATLREQAAALSDLHRRKDEFLAMLSHELRNPLAPITNALELLRLQRRSENATEQHARAVIERQVGQLKHLVDDLLEVSRVTTGRVRLRQERIDLQGIVDRAVETVLPLIEERRHELSRSAPPDPIWLHGDAARLEQVLVNLLANAAKYTDEGGQIGLAVEREGDRAVVRVRDTGVGIAPELLPRIFDLFTQAQRSLDRSRGGLGVGLSLVQRLVELHGGTVEATSVLGRGSEFIVRLPTTSQPPAPSPSATERAPRTQTSRRVLVVDDNVDAAESLAMLLSASGHEVRTAHEGEAALEAALGWRPEVVLLDIGLPGLDGFEVAKRMRRHLTLRDVMLVAMTGYGQDADRQRSLDSGFDRHLVKPVEPATVRNLVANVGEGAGRAKDASLEQEPRG